ncbi:hypothetical protein LptCag_1493 [Leptospirillum ferriphilum]|jgi:hypothetical protein|uniref:Uncharacterized protein n=1 Tax=Leptospirillum ferriphilum TaxID=178606 RepID=A0A094W8C6_9BACT|nr:hypothetical protein [Leptospirillum ferriphilum]KGA93783.1 hypothetical protein LptCag_1493 [Leptospirillum ferriphilum]
MKPGTFIELGKLALNGALAVSVAMIAQPLVENKFDPGVFLSGIAVALSLIGIGVTLLEKGG